MKKILVVLSAATIISATVLGDAARSMAPRTWKAVETGLTYDLYSEMGDMFVYANDAVWDPNTEKLFFMNAYHGQPGVGRLYDAKTNAWKKIPVGAWAWHVYDDLTIDRSTGLIYHFNTQRIVRRFNPATEVFDTLPSNGMSPILNGYSLFGMSMEYFPEMRSLINVQGASYFERVMRYSLSSNTWSMLAATDSIAMGGYHVLAEYNPVHKVVLFGGGNESTLHPGDDSKKMYKLDSTGKVTTLSPAPISFGIQQAALTCDPVSGTYLFLNSSKLYGYHVDTDTWEDLGANPGIDILYVAVSPVASYGVVLFMCGTGCSNHVMLYKYAAGSRVEKGLPRADRAGFSGPSIVYNIRGRVVARVGAGMTWNKAGVPAGVYMIARKQTLQKVIVVR